MWRRFLAVIIASTIAHAQGILTPEARQEILDYKLTMERANHLIAALPEMTKFFVSLPPAEQAKALKAKPADRLANTVNNPQTAAILKRHGLTAKEYLVGVPALRMALLVAQGIHSPNVVASPANVA